MKCATWNLLSFVMKCLLVGLNMLGAICLHCTWAYSLSIAGRTAFCPVLEPSASSPQHVHFWEGKLIPIGVGPTRQYWKCLIWTLSLSLYLSLSLSLSLFFSLQLRRFWFTVALVLVIPTQESATTVTGKPSWLCTCFHVPRAIHYHTRALTVHAVGRARQRHLAVKSLLFNLWLYC